MSRRRAPAALGALAVASVLGTGIAGCQAPEVQYTTRYLEIAPDFDYPVCEGTLADLDEHVEFVQSSLNRYLPEDERIRLYWITEDIAEWCNEGAGGCFYPGTRVIVGNAGSAKHEIVHAVLNAEARTNIFLEESIAELLSGVGVTFDPHDESTPSPASMIRANADVEGISDEEYRLGAHFMSYLHERHGMGPVQSFSHVVITGARTDDLEHAIEVNFDGQLDAVQSNWLAHSKNTYGGLRDRMVQRMPVEGRHEFELDCSSRSTRGPLIDGEGMYEPRRVSVEERSVFQVQVDASEHDDVWIEIIDIRKERARDHVVDPLHPVTLRDHPRMWPGEEATLELRAGTHLLVVGSTSTEPRQLGIDFTWVSSEQRATEVPAPPAN